MADLEASGSLETGVTEMEVIFPLVCVSSVCLVLWRRGAYQKLKNSWTCWSEVVDEMPETWTVERSDMVVEWCFGRVEVER